jgi:hypothetical protein
MESVGCVYGGDSVRYAEPPSGPSPEKEVTVNPILTDAFTKYVDVDCIVEELAEYILKDGYLQVRHLNYVGEQINGRPVYVHSHSGKPVSLDMVDRAKKLAASRRAGDS